MTKNKRNKLFDFVAVNKELRINVIPNALLYIYLQYFLIHQKLKTKIMQAHCGKLQILIIPLPRAPH